MWIDSDDKTRQISHKQIRQPFQHSVNPTNTPRPMSQTNGTGSTKKNYWEEMQRRRENVSFNCIEKFTLGHRCATSQAFVIEVCPHQEFLEGGGDAAWDDEPCGQGSTSRGRGGGEVNDGVLRKCLMRVLLLPNL